MNAGSMRFFSGLVAWEFVVLVPLAIMFFRAGRQLRGDDGRFLIPVALLGILVTTFCWLVAPKFAPVTAIVLGTLCGVVVAVLGGIVWAHLLQGFESSSATFSGSLMLAIPSGVGGGIAGWLNRQEP